MSTTIVTTPALFQFVSVFFDADTPRSIRRLYVRWFKKSPEYIGHSDTPGYQLRIDLLPPNKPFTPLEVGGAIAEAYGDMQYFGGCSLVLALQDEGAQQ